METNDKSEDEHEVKTENGIDSDDDDPIVERIPVYLANNMNAYLLQYPVRPSTMPYDGSQVKQLKFRPKHQQIEMHLDLETENDNYDESRGEQIALNTDGDKGATSTDSTFSSGRMDVQVLTGGKAVDDSSRYAVGIISNNKLHLTQLSGVLTVRPNLGYLDKSDKRAKAEGRNVDPDDVEPEKPKLEAVTVKFSKGEAENKRKDKTYQSLKNKEQEEAWVNLRFNQLRSAKWEDESQNLICDALDKKIKLDLPPQKYLDALKNAPLPAASQIS